MARFQKGESGNPAGRPKGTGQAAKLRQAIADDLPDILEAMVERAKEGDTAAAKLLLDRVAPALKAQSQPTEIRGLDTDNLTERADAVLHAAAQGDMPPDTAASLVSAVGNLARIVEIDELAQRVEALEQGHEAA